MSAPVLVGYATRYGSTQETAETVAAALRERGLAVDVQPLKQVRRLEGYCAVVLGAALYMGHWYKDADKFLEQHREALGQRPVAVFVLGPVNSPVCEEDMRGSRAQLDQMLAKYPWLAPVSREVFGGKYDPARLRFPDNLIAGLPASPLKTTPAGDARDMAAIRAWASGLAARLQPAPAR